jgi:hypothetical protein
VVTPRSPRMRCSWKGFIPRIVSRSKKSSVEQSGKRAILNPTIESCFRIDRQSFSGSDQQCHSPRPTNSHQRQPATESTKSCTQNQR